MPPNDNNGNGSLQQINETITKIQKLVESNQKDYTDSKFEQISQAFEHLKQEVLTEFSHNQELQDTKKLLAGEEFKSLRKQLETFEKGHYVTATDVENQMNQRSERKWAPWLIVIIMFVIFTAGGLFSYFDLQGDFKAHIQGCAQFRKSVNIQVEDIKEDIDESEKDLKQYKEKNTENHNKIKLDIEKLKNKL